MKVKNFHHISLDKLYAMSGVYAIRVEPVGVVPKAQVERACQWVVELGLIDETLAQPGCGIMN